MTILDMPDAERIDEILRRRRAGETYEQIARRLGVTRQRVHQILTDAGSLHGLTVEVRVTRGGVLVSADVDPDVLADRIANVLEGLAKMDVRRRFD